MSVRVIACVECGRRTVANNNRQICCLPCAPRRNQRYWQLRYVKKPPSECARCGGRTRNAKTKYCLTCKAVAERANAANSSRKYNDAQRAKRRARLAPKPCCVCGQTFRPRRVDSTYCSQLCRGRLRLMSSTETQMVTRRAAARSARKARQSAGNDSERAWRQKHKAHLSTYDKLRRSSNPEHYSRKDWMRTMRRVFGGILPPKALFDAMYLVHLARVKIRKQMTN